MVQFGGLALTEIFELPQIQCLLVKIWYHGLLCDYDMTPEQFAQFKITRKNVTFANCFTFQMQIKMYLRLFERLYVVVSELQCQKIYDTIVSYIKTNRLNFIAFEIFGLHFLQLFGKLLDELDDKRMAKIIRKVFISITEQTKGGSVKIRKQVQPARIQEELISAKQKINGQIQKLNASSCQYSEQAPESKKRNLSVFLPRIDNRNLSQRMKLKQFITKTDKLSEKNGSSYPIDQRMRGMDRASLSCFMIGGFQIVDYSESINQLHRKLLTKIRLNK